jgi:dCMP deaminase
VRLLESLGYKAELIETDNLSRIFSQPPVAMLDDDISRALASQHLTQESDVVFEPVFLRWNRQNANAAETVKPDKLLTASQAGIDTEKLLDAAGASNDWWRSVAAGLVVDGRLETFYNHSLQHQYINSTVGDPRILSKRGQDIDLSVFIHAEAALIASMARQGIKTDGQTIYVTTFPCPTCSKLIAASGFKRCCFVEGYATLDGYEVLKAAGVEIVKIQTDQTVPLKRNQLRDYPERPNG